jgi:hypothetical protein
MSRDFPEADWKLFRQLREQALERFCERILNEVEKTSSDSAASCHDRYLRVFRLLQRRDREIADAFNDPRRSQAMIQLARMKSLRLLEPEELNRFTTSSRDMLAILTDDRGDQ